MKVTQTYTLYRTNGNIDKENNIYFVPRHSGNLPYPVQINQLWLQKFNEVANKHSTFDNVSISSWSPEDRTLDINSIPDIFRARGMSGAYDYVIVSRTLTDENETKRYYMAYFIEDVEQVGLNTTRLTLSKDNFTNAVYLLNESLVFNSEEDILRFNNPLSSMLVNTYVERQHYDRIRDGKLSNDILFYTYTEDLGFNVTKKVEKNVIYYDISEKKLKVCSKELLDEINSYGDYNNLTNELKVVVRSLCMAYATIIAKESIIYPIPEYSKPAIFNHIVLTGGTNCNYSSTRGISEGYQRLILPFVSVPNFLEIVNIPSTFGFSFKDEDSSVYDNLEEVYDFECKGMEEFFTLINPRGLIPHLQEISISRYSKMGEYSYFSGDKVIFSVLLPTLTGNSHVIDGEDEFYYASNRKIMETKKGLYVSTILKNASEVGKGYEYDNPIYMNYNIRDIDNEKAKRFLYIGPSINPNFKAIYLSLSSYSYSDFLFYLVDDEPLYSSFLIDLMNNYEYEIITNLYPYKYHSITYAGSSAETKLTDIYYIEEIDNEVKINYDLKLITSNNVTSKFALIPYFNENNYVISDLINSPNFNESLTLVLDNDIPLRESSYYSYLYQNKAQMKNQFAVATLSSVESGINTLVKTSSNVATLGALGYSDKAILGAVGGVSDLVTTPISHAFNVQKIKVSQKARLQDTGVKPDTLKSTGTDVFFDLMFDDLFIYFNTYKVDEVSKNNIEKYLSRYGYLVDRYDTINMNNRRYINYVKLKSLEFSYLSHLSNEQENEIKRILYEGVTFNHSIIDEAFIYENDEVPLV